MSPIARQYGLPCALLAVAGIGPLGYPAWLALTSRKRPPAAPQPAAWPPITALVPAYRERHVVGAKVDDLHANGYPGLLHVLVLADDPATAEAARATDAEVIEATTRLGKAEALNMGFAHARDPLVILTDANTRLAPGSLAALVRWMERADVGAVAGEKRVLGEHQSAYWRYESWLKRREWARASTVGLVGELAAIRRDLVGAIPADVSVDDLWLALDVIESGFRIAYEPSAVAIEQPSEDWRAEWERRTRVVCGMLDVLWRRRALCRPSAGSPWVELWGHRLVRSSAGPLAHLTLLGVTAARAQRGRFARAFVLAHVAAAVAAVRSARGTAGMTTAERVVAQVVVLQAVALGGLWRYSRGDRPARWLKPERPPIIEVNA